MRCIWFFRMLHTCMLDTHLPQARLLHTRMLHNYLPFVGHHAPESVIAFWK